MVWMWAGLATSLASVGVVIVFALCRVAAAADETRRALRDEAWANLPPTRALAASEREAHPLLLRSKR